MALAALDSEKGFGQQSPLRTGGFMDFCGGSRWPVPTPRACTHEVRKEKSMGKAAPCLNQSTRVFHNRRVASHSTCPRNLQGFS